MSDWSGTIIESDTDGQAVNPDLATGHAVLVEWKRADIPGARVTSTYAVIEEPENPDDTDSPVRYAVAEMTEFILATDPEDIGGTEIDSNYEYGDGSTLNYATLDEARGVALTLARAELAHTPIMWDGTSEGLRRK